MKENDPHRPKRTRKTYPVPAWMDEALKPQAERLDVLGRHQLAAALEQRAKEFERQANQLRELKPPPVEWAVKAEVRLRPNMKRAVLAFAKHHGADDKHEESVKLELGIRWFLEDALPLITLASKHTDKRIRYRELEGLEDSRFTERLIGDALAKYEATQEQSG